MVALLRRRAKAPEDVLLDHALWKALADSIKAQAAALFREIFLVGAEAGRLILPVGTKELLPLDPNEINIAADRLIATYVDDWWRRLETNTQNSLRQAIQRAKAEGTGIEGILKEIEPLFGPRRGLTIATTETTRLFGLGAQATYAASGLDHWSWQTVQDPAVDDICRELQGQQFPIDQPFTPAHVNCILEGTLVSGPQFLAATRRWYEGEVIILRTALGNELAITPNHPIATPAGWVAADLLREGDDVIAQVPEGMATGFDPDHVEAPARIEEVAGTLFELGAASSLRVPASPEDFHGDGGDGYVEIVGTDRLLGDHSKALRLEVAHDSLLQMRRSPRALVGAGPPDFLSKGHHAAPGRLVGGPHLPGPSGRVHLRPLKALGRALITQLDACPEEAPPDRHAVHAEALGKSVLGHPIPIEQEDFPFRERLPVGCRTVALVKVRRVRIARHVYNLQTSSGWYIAGGIAVCNCRCFPRPVVELPEAPARRRRGGGTPAAPTPETAPADHFPAEDFTWTAEVEAFLKRSFPETIFDFSNMEPRVANVIGREFDRLAREWPEVQKRLYYLGTNGRVPKGYEPYVRSFAGHPNYYAQATRDGRSISLNPKYFQETDAALRVRYWADTTSGWHAQITDTDDYGTILTHEFGHQIHNLFLQTRGRQVTLAIRVSGFGEVRSTFDIWAAKNKPWKVSTYGNENWEEGWAESFVVQEHGTPAAKRHPFVKKQKVLLDALHPSRWRDNERGILFTTDLISDGPARKLANDQLEALRKKLGFKWEDI